MKPTECEGPVGFTERLEAGWRPVQQDKELHQAAGEEAW